MPTTEQFLVNIGIDPQALSRVIADLQRLKQRAEATTVNVDVQTNAAAVAAEVSQAAQQAAVSMDQSFATVEDGIRDIEKGLGDLKGTFLALGAAAGVFAALGFREAAAESTNLARANVILGFSTEELGKRQEELRDVAREAGLTYKEVSAALFDVASAGFKGQAAINATRAAARAAVPAGIDVTTAFNAIATAMTNFGLSADEAGDKLVKVADLTRGSLANVSAALGRIAPTAAALGISLDDVGAAFATVTNKGESAEEASTLVFNAINKFTAPSKEAAEALTAIGIASGDAAFHQQSLAEKLELVAQAAAEGRIEISKVFAIRGGRAVRAIISDMDKFRENLEEVGASAGRTQAGLEAFFQEQGPQWTRMKNQVINAATAVGTDLLNAIVPVAAVVGDWIERNEELVKLLAKIGIVIGTLVVSFIAWKAATKALVASKLVLVGVTKVLTGALTLETAGVWASVAAWGAHLKAQILSAKGPLIGAIRAVVTVLAMENAAIWASVKAWTVRVGLAVWDAVKRTYLAIVIGIKWLWLHTAALWANTKAAAANAFAQGGLRGSLNALVGPLGKNIASMSAAATAAGVLGAAIVGWQIGKAINDWLELEKATTKFVQAGEASWKTGLLNVITLGALSRARARVVAEQKKVNTLTAQQQTLLESTSGAQAKYQRWLAKGVGHYRAFVVAISDVRTELAQLELLQKRQGQLSLDDQRRLLELQTLVAKLQTEIAERKKLVRSEQQAILRAQQDINATTSQWEELVKQTDKAYAQLRRRELAASVEDIGKFEKGFELARKRLAAFMVEWRNLTQQRLTIREEGTEDMAFRLEENLRVMNVKRQEIEETLNTLDKNVALVNNSIIANGKAFIQRLESNAKEEIETYKETSDEIIQIEQRKLEELTRLLRQLQNERNAAVRASEQFVRKLEEAEIRRRDPALLDIIRLEREYTELLKRGIPTQELRVRQLELLTEELQRLASATREEIRLRQEAARVERELQQLDEERDEGRRAEREAELLREQERLQERLADVEEKRQIRREQAERIIAEATKGSAEALEAFKQRDQDITRIKTDQEKIEENLKSIAEERSVIEGEIRDRMADQVEKAKALVAEQLKAVEAAWQFATLIVSTKPEDARQFSERMAEYQRRAAEAFAELREVSLDEIAQGVTDAQQELEALGQTGGKIRDWLDKLREGVSRTEAQISEQGTVIVPAAASVTETFDRLQANLEPQTNALRELLEATQSFAPELDRFSTEATDRISEMRIALDGNTSTLRENNSRLAALERSTVGGGANGLPQ